MLRIVLLAYRLANERAVRLDFEGTFGMVSTTVAAPARASQREPRQEEKEPLTLGLWLIIAFKSIGALVLWTAFALLLILAAGRDNPQDFVSHVIFRTFRGNPPDIAIRFLTHNIQFINAGLVIRIALATSAYAIVVSAEAIGLILRKWWAEWLVILVTASFIPVEVYEIFERPNPLKIGTLVVNLIILWYLVKRRLDKRAEHAHAILDRS